MKYWQIMQSTVLVAVIVGPSQAAEKVDRERLIQEVCAYQAKAHGKTISVECTASTRFMDGNQTVAFEKPARFLFDGNRLFISAYVGGQTPRGIELDKREFGYDGRTSVSLNYDGDQCNSATSDCKPPASLQVLDPNICGGVCIAYATYRSARGWLKAAKDESFVAAFLRQCDKVERKSDPALDDELVASWKSGRTTRYLVLKITPAVHCVQYRSELETPERTSIETIDIRYESVGGVPQVVGSSRSVSSRTVAQEGESTVKLSVACQMEINKLQFLSEVEDERFLPSIPDRVPVIDMCGKNRKRQAPQRQAPQPLQLTGVRK